MPGTSALHNGRTEREDRTAERVQGIYRPECRKGGRKPKTLQTKTGHRGTSLRYHKKTMGVRPCNDEEVKGQGLGRRGAYLYRLQPQEDPQPDREKSI